MGEVELIEAVARSIAELRAAHREPVRIRLHPLDAETIIASRLPDQSLKPLTMLSGLPVALDETTRLGEPVAEF